MIFPGHGLRLTPDLCKHGTGTVSTKAAACLQTGGEGSPLPFRVVGEYHSFCYQGRLAGCGSKEGLPKAPGRGFQVHPSTGWELHFQVRKNWKSLSFSNDGPRAREAAIAQGRPQAT